MSIEKEYPFLYQLLGSYLNIEVFGDEEYSEENAITNFVESSYPDRILKTKEEIKHFLKNSLSLYKDVVEISNYMIYEVADNQVLRKEKVKIWLTRILDIIENKN